MADIELHDLEAVSEQSPGTPFPVSVGVENNEAVAPIYGAEALCSAGVFSPDGHRVEVTFRLRDGAGDTVDTATTEVCATVKQPSNVAGETRAEVDLEASTSGEYSIEADAVVPGAGGSASIQPVHITVGEGVGSLPDPTDPDDSPTFPNIGGNGLPDEWVAIGVLLLVIVLLGAVR
jgi:hypothetical protein